MNNTEVQLKYDDLKPYLNPKFTAEDVNAIYRQVVTILERYDGCGVGRTSGTDATAQEDCENTLITHSKRGLYYTKTHHIYSLPSSDAMIRLEAYILAKLNSEGYSLENIAYDGRGDVSEDAEAFHLYVATTSEKKKL